MGYTSQPQLVSLPGFKGTYLGLMQLLQVGFFDAFEHFFHPKRWGREGATRICVPGGLKCLLDPP